MTKEQAKKLKTGDKIRVTKNDVTFFANIIDKDENALSFMQHLNSDDQFAPKRVGLVALKEIK